MLEILEPINVWVFFKESSVEPWCFFWNKRQIKIDKINLVHTSKEGSNIFYHFSVSAGGNFYRLKFDTESLKWHLEMVEEDF
jgi:hypothetical protein